MQEATRITKVNSADVVADPAAGGKATRVLAGGIETDPEPPGRARSPTCRHDHSPCSPRSRTATPEELAAVGLSKALVHRSRHVEPEPVTESGGRLEKASFLGGLMIKEKVEAAGLPVRSPRAWPPRCRTGSPSPTSTPGRVASRARWA
jgi:hypothetical protein